MGGKCWVWMPARPYPQNPIEMLIQTVILSSIIKTIGSDIYNMFSSGPSITQRVSGNIKHTLATNKRKAKVAKLGKMLQRAAESDDVNIIGATLRKVYRAHAEQKISHEDLYQTLQPQIAQHYSKYIQADAECTPGSISHVLYSTMHQKVINTFGANGGTALHLAVEYGAVNHVSFILTIEMCDLFKRNGDGLTAQELAVKLKHDTIAAIIASVLDNKVSPEEFLHAAACGNINQVQLYIDQNKQFGAAAFFDNDRAHNVAFPNMNAFSVSLAHYQHATYELLKEQCRMFMLQSHKDRFRNEADAYMAEIRDREEFNRLYQEPPYRSFYAAVKLGAKAPTLFQIEQNAASQQPQQRAEIRRPNGPAPTPPLRKG